MEQPTVEIKWYKFGEVLFDELETNHFAKDPWPLVYILSDGDTKQAYVGETTDVYSRMNTHLKNVKKGTLTSVHLVTSSVFNKSAALDIESNLIKYMSGDWEFILLNGNLGLANHNYYQKKEVYWNLFITVWNNLRSEGIAKHSIEYINNSDLFKYSPYKSLTKEQANSLYEILTSLVSWEYKNILIEGWAWTGKTILAIFLFKILSSKIDDFNFSEFWEEEIKFRDVITDLREKMPNPKMAIVVPMSSFRNTLKKVFKNIKGLSTNMIIGPAEVGKEKYDLLVVDESHRLRRRVNLGAYFGAFDKVNAFLGLEKNTSNELDWVTLQSKHTILFYDEGQSIKPSDVQRGDSQKLKASKKTIIQKLKSQFRVKGWNEYVEFIDSLLHCRLKKDHDFFHSQEYEFKMFDSLEEMVEQIKKRDSESGLSRLIAGYSWPWISKNDKSLYDIVIEDFWLQWNSVSDDFINSENAINEVGCIHTTQWYDLNYSGIIFGNEISYDSISNQIIINEKNYFDKNGKQWISDPAELKTFILNIYKTILLRWIKGTYIYACDLELRKYFESFIPTLKKIQKISFQIMLNQDVIPYVNSVPLYHLTVSAGNFSEAQKVSDLQWIKLPEHIRLSKDLFVCQVIGESMNQIIPNGSYCLFRRYTGGSRNGQIVLVENTDTQDTDFGSCYTIKEYQSKKHYDEDGWGHQSIILKPLSNDSNYQDIVLHDDKISSFRVLGIFECIL